MTPNEYQQKALRTEPPCVRDDFDQQILHGVLGIGGEAGECQELVKKHVFQGHDLNISHLAKELGDVCWYIAVTAAAIGYDFNDILEMNIEKHEKRYPNGFEVERSIHRDPNDI